MKYLFLLLLLPTIVHASCGTELDFVNDALARLESEPAMRLLAKEMRDGYLRRTAAVLNLQEERTFENTIQPLDNVLEFLNRKATMVDHLANNVEVAPAVLKAKKKVDEVVAESRTEFDTDARLHQAVATTTGLSGPQEELRLGLLRHFEKAGAHLPPDRRGRVQELSRAQSEISRAFSDAMNADQTRIELTDAELAGQPADWIAANAPGGRLLINKSSVVIEFLARAPSEEVRRKVYLAFQNRMPENLDRLFAYTKGYAKIAGQFGQTHLQRTLDERSVAGSPRWVENTLREIAAKIKPRVRQRLDRLRELKTADGSTAPLRPWDFAHYDARLGTTDSGPDAWARKLAGTYFPAKRVFGRMLEVVGEAFGLEFHQVADAKVWDPNVKVYRVRDRDAGRDLGYIYADLFSRPGKNPGSAFVEELVSRTPDRLPVTFLATNWGDATNLNELFLDSSEVETGLHELGHALHVLMSHGDRYLTAAFRHPMDLTEMPSTTLERLVKTPAGLTALSSHELDPARRLPKDVAAQLARPQPFTPFAGPLFSTRYGMNTIFLAIVDLELHKAAADLKSAEDMFAIYRREYQDFYGVDPSPEDHFVQNFWHMMWPEYAGNYSAYVVAHVIAANMGERIDELGGMLSPTAMQAWRRMSLEPPAFENPAAREIVEGFLGRPLTVEPFLKEQGLE